MAKQGYVVKDFSEMKAFFSEKMVWVMTNTVHLLQKG